MKFTPSLNLKNGKLNPLEQEDAQVLFQLYQKLGLPEHKRPKKVEDLQRLIQLSVQMAATQRGMMWLVIIKEQAVGILNLFDWQPSQLKASIRMDACEQLQADDLSDALNVSMDYLSERYHLRNFCYPLIKSNANPVAKEALNKAGFKFSLTQRQAHVLDDNQYSDIELYHNLSFCSLD